MGSLHLREGRCVPCVPRTDDSSFFPSLCLSVSLSLAPTQRLRSTSRLNATRERSKRETGERERRERGTKDKASKAAFWMSAQDDASASPPPKLLPGDRPKPSGKRKVERPFVFDNYPRRKIALRISYHGHVHDGLAKQEETANTVEGIVVAALKRVRLIPESGPEKFSRCGRTDKGVSAMGNALSFVARSSCWPCDEPQKPPLDYCHMLNGVLPPTIRAVGFALVPDDFDARFSCVGRTYRYYFCHRGLDVDAMQRAARFMLGTHSFRNLCKTDVVNVSNFERNVTSVGVYASDLLPECISYFEIQANSFLYHQIRCTMEVLFLVGRGLEKPEVVQTLLSRGDEKPQYPLADGTPLVLWDCKFPEAVRWHTSHRAFQAAERELQDISTALLIRATAAAAMRQQLFHWYSDSEDVCVQPGPLAAATGEEQHEEAEEEDGKRKPSRGAPSRPRVVRGRPPRSPREKKGSEEAEEEEVRDFTDADCMVVDGWSITGCDWTEPRTHVNLPVRKYDLFNALRHEDALALGQQRGRPPAVYIPKGYVPLLERETERTYDEQVAKLGGGKRTRYEVNERKKAAGAARVAAQRLEEDAELQAHAPP